MDPDTGSHDRLTTGQDTWRARCVERRTAGSGGGSQETVDSNIDIAPAGLPHCLAPGCHRPAQRCETDHNRDYGRGKNGETSKCNLCCLCKTHHRLKDQPGWSFAFNGDTGELAITTPTGKIHRRRPEPILHPVEKNDDDDETE